MEDYRLGLVQKWSKNDKVKKIVNEITDSLLEKGYELWLTSTPPEAPSRKDWQGIIKKENINLVYVERYTQVIVEALFCEQITKDKESQIYEKLSEILQIARDAYSELEQEVLDGSNKKETYSI